MHTIKEVLRLTAAGLSQRQIAHNLDLSNGVVGKSHAASASACNVYKSHGSSWVPIPEPS